ncbi:hypothetical protein JCM11251_003363 [Rhodosporidiobolus azoricus]
MPPTRIKSDEQGSSQAALQEEVYPIGSPTQRFYVRPLFPMMHDAANVEAVLRQNLRDSVPLPSAPAGEVAHVACAQAIFFRQLQEYLAAGEAVARLEDEGQRIPDAKWADMYRPLVYLEKLKELSERHQHQHGHDPFGLSPSRSEWLAHRTEPATVKGTQEDACNVAKDAALWLYGKWKAGPEGKRAVGLHGHQEKGKWVEERARELQDTFDWVLGMLDNEHRKLPFARPHMAAVQRRWRNSHRS